MRWQNVLPVAWIGLLLTGLHPIAGCNSGPETGEVRGKVTFKGQPVKEGNVTFSKEGGNYEAQIQTDGSFAVASPVVVGEYVIEVTPLMHLVDTDPGKSPPAPMEKPAPDIPRKYRQRGTTPFKETVKAGKNELNLDMKP
jgi:hypothetical protein